MVSDKQQLTDTQGADIRQTLGLDKASNKRGTTRKWWWFVAATFVLTLLIWQILGSSDSNAINYKTADVSRGSMNITVTATGTLQPVNQVEVGSEISGTIKNVLVDFNDYIKTGQVLAHLNTDQLQAKTNQANASLVSAKAQVKQVEATIIETKNTLSRSRELAKTGMCSIEDCDAAQASYDRALADLASAEAKVVQSQAALDAELTMLEKATIHSPIDGIVLVRDVEPGQTVAASFQTPVLFTLAEDLAQMELHVDVDEADVGQIIVGQQAFFTVDAYANKKFPATITDVHFASQTVDGVVSYETVLSVDNSSLLLRPGMTATADILVKQIEDALLISNAALRFQPPKPDQQAQSKGGFVSSLMPGPPPASNDKTNKKLVSENQQQVWKLQEGQPIEVNVSVGASNGIQTEITAGDIEVGMALIIDTISSK